MIKPWLDLCRVSNLPTVWTNVLCAIVLSGSLAWPNFLRLVLSLSLFYAGGMCLNDICDVTNDRQQRPTRPLPSGKISITQASLFTVTLFAAGFAPLFFMPHPRAGWWGLALLVVILVYDRCHKAHPWSVLLMAACRLLIFVIAAIAVTDSLTRPVAIAAALQFAYVLIISLTARWENRRGTPFPLPVIPWLIAGIALLDGIAMAMFVAPLWLLAGIGGMMLTRLGQRYVRGD